MDDKLIRLARKVKTLEDELSRLSQIKDLEGLLVASTDMNSRYKKSINETVGMYKEYISNTKKELMDSFEAIKKEQKEKNVTDKKNLDNLEAKINKVKDDIQKVCTSIDKSIEDIQKDILKDIKDKNNQILLNLDKKDKELKEVKQENIGLVKDLKALKDLVNRLELQKGDDGKSAYDIACELGFKGTKEEWIKSLHGKDGQDIELRGLRAFSDAPKDNKMYARKNKKWVEVESGGGSGTQSDWNESDSTSMAYIKNKPTNLVSDTDYATSSKGGVIKVSGNDYGLGVYNGFLYPLSQTYANYQNKYNDFAISKGTLENVITGKQLVNETQLNTKADKSSLVTGSGENITLQNTAELEFIQPPLPKGNSEQVQYSGKNKLNATQESWNLAANTTVYQAIVTTANKPYLEAGTKYYFSYNIDNASSSNTRSTLRLYLNQEYLQSTSTNNNLTAGRKVWEFTPTVSGNYEVQYWLQGSNVAVTVSDFMISTSSDTTYEPYVGGTASPNPSYPQAITNVTGDVEVLIQNKNILRDDISYTSTYHDSRTYLDLNIILGTASTLYAKWVYAGRVDNTGRVYASFTTTADYTRFLIKHNGSTTDLAKTYDFDFKNNTTYIISINLTGVNPTVDGGFSYNDVMITTGSADYEPHKEQTFTFPLGTQRMYLGDYLADDGIHHVRGRIILDGSEDWLQNTVYNNVYYIENFLADASTKEPRQMLSDYFTYGGLLTQGSGDVENGKFYQWTQLPKRLIIGYNSTVLNDLKTWLASNNVIVEYELEQEEIIPYTESQQAAYNEIKQAISYEEQTNISGTSDESNPLFEVQAVQYKEPDYWTIAYVNTQIGNAIGGAY